MGRLRKAVIKYKKRYKVGNSQATILPEVWIREIKLPKQIMMTLDVVNERIIIQADPHFQSEGDIVPVVELWNVADNRGTEALTINVG